MNTFGTRPQLKEVNVADPKIAFDNAMQAPMTDKATDMAKAIESVSLALDLHKKALFTGSVAVLGLGRITGLTQKMNALNGQLALGTDQRSLEDGFKRSMELIASKIDDINNPGLRSIPSMATFSAPQH